MFNILQEFTDKLIEAEELSADQKDAFKVEKNIFCWFIIHIVISFM